MYCNNIEIVVVLELISQIKQKHGRYCFLYNLLLNCSITVKKRGLCIFFFVKQSLSHQDHCQILLFKLTKILKYSIYIKTFKLQNRLPPFYLLISATKANYFLFFLSLRIILQTKVQHCIIDIISLQFRLSLSIDRLNIYKLLVSQ